MNLLRALPLVLTLLTAGCRSTPSGAGAPPEASVRPGVNTEYLKPDVDVDQWVDRFEREGREIYDHRAEILEAMRVRPGMSVADVGAGSGLFTLPLAERVGTGGRVFAVDIVPDFLRHIEAAATQAGLANVNTVLATERSVELPRGSIDLAFLCDTYHHFEYPQSTLASLRLALRPGGQIFLVEFKRVDGESTDWVLHHVRAGQDVFTREIEQAGFELTEELDLLLDNYVLRFRRK